MAAQEVINAMTINRLFNIAIASLLFSFLAILTPVSKTKDNVTAESALAELTAGNAHHVAHRYQHPHETLERQRELASGPEPARGDFELRRFPCPSGTNI